ncbi:hypothetical protein LOTGIDRAFT_174019 [Lottia gigantea]|uniref:Uncharacterized protein n=1 Tax=Lottia gigantea TaxID=225164 RepID=V4CB10_LOTGI|nr:hypothetical protein LOTGIDRAFT_174019 [Lottia gigantea]ESO99019.1 hypothetical protein LOTGIDRAFT_174019 [Lottia gigantea]
MSANRIYFLVPPQRRTQCLFSIQKRASYTYVTPKDSIDIEANIYDIISLTCIQSSFQKVTHKSLSIRGAFIILDITLLTVIQQSQSTTVRVNLCKKYKQRRDVFLPPLKTKPNKLLAASLESFKDVESVIDKHRKLYEKAVGSHQLIIKNMGLKDFYPTTKDTKLFKLPRKRKVRVLFEIQWMLTSMLYHLEVADVLEKDFSFRKVEMMVKVLGDTWKLLMNSYNTDYSYFINLFPIHL